jgi:hypothetical protein
VITSSIPLHSTYHASYPGSHADPAGGIEWAKTSSTNGLGPKQCKKLRYVGLRPIISPHSSLS